MSTSVSTVVNEKLSSAWQDDFLTHLLPRVKTHARFRFRNLPMYEREEAEAEAVAVALVFFVRLVERGKNPSVFALRIARVAVLRVTSGRLVGSRERSRDVLSRLARQRRGFVVESLSGSQQVEGEWREMVVEDRTSTPADIAASRLDFAAWLGQMKRRRRQIAETLAAGYRTEEVAQQFRLSPGRVSQIRREFEASWRKFQQDREKQTAAA